MQIHVKKGQTSVPVPFLHIIKSVYNIIQMLSEVMIDNPYTGIEWNISYLLNP